jgi:hypothetical protein
VPVPAGAVAVREVNVTMTQTIPRSKSRKVNGYVKAVLGLEAVRKKREERYERFVRPLDRKRDVLAAEVAARERALTGGQHAEARRILGTLNGSITFKYQTE